MNNFFAYIFRMKYVRRWALMKNMEEENLQGHSIEVAMIAHCLALIRRDVFGQECDPDRIAVVAMYHDAEEILTGDLPTPVKYMNSRIFDAYHSIELGARDKLLEELPDEIREEYEGILYSSEWEKEEYKLVKAADRLAAYIKCLNETKIGNGEFKKAMVQTKQRLDDMHMPEIDYFTEHFIPSFSLSLHELESDSRS